MEVLMKLTKLSAALAASALVLAACGSGPDLTGVEIVPAGESDLLAPGVEINGDYDPTPDVKLGKCSAGEFGDVAAPVTRSRTARGPRGPTRSPWRL
jgi:hypothetical protein